MKVPLMLFLITLDLAAMQEVEIPADTHAAAINIITRTNRLATPTNINALNHVLKLIKASPGRSSDPEAGKLLTKLDSLKHKVEVCQEALKAPTLNGKPGSSVQAGNTIIKEAEELVDEAVDLWVSKAQDETTSQRRQKIGAMISTGASLVGNVILVAAVVYLVRHNSSVNPFSSAS